MVTENVSTDYREKLSYFRRFAEIGKRPRAKQKLKPVTADGSKPIYFNYYRDTSSEYVTVDFPQHQLTLVHHKHSNDVEFKIDLRKRVTLSWRDGVTFQSVPLETLKVVHRTIDSFNTLMLIRYWLLSLFK